MGFTPRQAQILERAARGRSDKQIAGDLGVSVHTVRSHLRRLYETLGLANRAEAVATFMTEQAEAAEPPPEPQSGGWQRPQPRALVAGLVAGVTLALAAAAAWSLAPPSVTGMTTLPAAPAAARHRLASPTPAQSAKGPAAPTPAAAAGADPASADPTTPPSAAPPAARPPVPAPPPTAPIQLIPAMGQLNLINQERATAGLPPLAWNQCLAGVASAQARRMAQQGYVSGAGGVTDDASCRLAPTTPAEELAYWPGASDAQINAVLIANPADQAKLLGPYRYLGAYWAISPTGLAFVALELA